MYLCTTPLPRFHTCNKKVFRPNEYHVTRLARHSVLILMLDGVLRFNEDGNDLELHAGEYYIQREGLQQTGRVLGELPRYYYLEFYGSYTDTPSDGLPLRGRWNRDAILPLAEQCVEALFSEQASPFTLEAYLLRILAALQAAAPAQDSRAAVICRLHDYLEANFSADLSQQALAAKFGYSADHLCRLFRAAYGTTPHAYTEALRMKSARWLVEHTDLPIQGIAERVGYAEFTSFWRSFLRAFGVTPSALRRQTESPSSEASCSRKE